MTDILSWLLCMACVLTGGLALARGVRFYAADQTVARRFRQHISPSLAPPWPAMRGRALLENFGRMVAGTDSVRGLQGLLLQAGFLSSGAVFLFAGLRLIAALTVAGMTLLPHWLHDGNIGSGDAAMAFFLGFFVYRAFSIFLKLRSETRQREIRRELPYILDLLLMVLDSGVSIDQALQHVSLQVARVAPLSGQILVRYIADTEDGVPYDKALDRLAQRLAISEGRDFAGLLKQNLFQGGELAQPLRRLAGDISETRLSLAREQMGRKSVLLTLVMLAFFMPVLLIAIAAPAVSDVLSTMHHVAQDMAASRSRK
ncbi:MAG: type II secretion system F family protein [Alphaproteobacteria bacterium]|nr:type II secretion system F family protein [Alphaproteobacteria bacterium]